MLSRIQRDLNALMIVVLSGVLLSAFGVQFFLHEEPCPLCMLQRIGMIGVAVGAMLNVWFGVRMAHYGICLLSALFGGAVALRQISLHVCPGFPEFGLPVLGLSLYTWSFFVFVCIVFSVAVLLFFYDATEHENAPPEHSWWSKFACGLILAIAVANIITTFAQCGFGPCVD